MLSNVIEVFKGFFSRSFWFANFLPVAMFAFLHPVIAWWVIPGIPLAEWARSEPSSLTYFPVAFAVLVVAAYALTPIVPLLRGLLTVRFCPRPFTTSCGMSTFGLHVRSSGASTMRSISLIGLAP